MEREVTTALQRFRATAGQPLRERIASAIGPVRFANGVLFDSFDSSVSVNDARLNDRTSIIQCAAVVRALELISSNVADLFTDTLHITDSMGERVPNERLTKNQRALLELLRTSPNRKESSNEFFTNMVIDYLMSGNSVVVADRSMGGISRLQRMVGETASVGVTPTGTEYYTGEIVFEPRTRVIYSETNVCHIRYRNLSGVQIPDTRRGFVPGLTDILQRTLKINIDLDQYVSDWFSSDARTLRLAVSSEIETSKKAQEDFKNYLRAEAQKGNTVIYVPAGMKVEAIGAGPSDASLDALREYQIREVARAFSVPPYTLGLDKAGVQIETVARDIYTMAVKPHVNAIKGALTHAFLNRAYETKGFKFEVDPMMMLRGNTAAIVSLVQATKGDAQTPGLLASQELRQLMSLSGKMPEDVNAEQIEKALAARQSKSDSGFDGEGDGDSADGEDDSNDDGDDGGEDGSGK